ncbi:Eukaryotic peptide chain release factor subunit 1-3 [Quillaja saponaria]|uniref:Eukaryotic peptide chain release factor subunit 1-3 n=1 Tax=Quillaja saponaria TaxID=32244 RepID=A0AAD7PWN4_QUISA|nr:Eukaryotic peptide chain release factor subunit 1-3 [Quillaja saponaria]
MDQSGSDADRNIELWKLKKSIKELEAAKGNGTSMISLIIPPNNQISQVTKMLGEEYGTASNIKSRVNRQSVLSAIKSAQHRLKLYKKVPPNGLIIYTGMILTEDGKERKFTLDLEPFKPINKSLYVCDKRFHTEPLSELLECDEKFAFIIMDGKGTLFGKLSGNTRTVLHKYSVSLPNKHGRGGQSAQRFGRLRQEACHNYLKKTAEKATELFIDPATHLPNVLKLVDISYGGESGFLQAIELSADVISNVKFLQEKGLIEKFFKEISHDTGKYVFGAEDTISLLETGAIKTLIVWENLGINRYLLRNNITGKIIIKHLNEEQESDKTNFHDLATSSDLEILEKISLLEWFSEQYKKFGCSLEIVSESSQEGSQFCRGFGGIGGILHYQVDLSLLQESSDDVEAE